MDRDNGVVKAWGEVGSGLEEVNGEGKEDLYNTFNIKDL